MRRHGYARMPGWYDMDYPYDNLVPSLNVWGSPVYWMDPDITLDFPIAVFRVEDDVWIGDN